MPLFALFIEDEISAPPVADGSGGVVIPTRAGNVHVLPRAFVNEPGHTRVMKTESWAPLSVEQLTATEPLPGNDPSVPGFVGSIVQVSGNYNSDTGRIEVDFLPPFAATGGEPIAEPFPRVVVGPPERVIGGPVTAALAGDVLQVAGVDIRLVGDGLATNDLRLPQLGARNDFGIPIDLGKVQPVNVPPGPGNPTPALATVNGWWTLPSDAAGRRFVGYDVVVDTTDRRILVDSLLPQISVTKAQARRRGSVYDISIQGGITAWLGAPDAMPRTILRDPQRIRVHRVDYDPNTKKWIEDPIQIGFVNDARIVRGKPFAKWQLKATHALPADRPFPPMKVRAYMISSDAKLANAGTEPVTPEGEELVEWIKG